MLFQNKYKEDGKKSLSQSIYSQLPETSDTQFAKTVSQTQSEVRQDRERCYFFDTGDILVRMRSCWAVTDYYGLYGSRWSTGSPGREETVALCTLLYLRHWRPSTLERPPSYRVRYNHTRTHTHTHTHLSVVFRVSDLICYLLSQHKAWNTQGHKRESVRQF